MTVSLEKWKQNKIVRWFLQAERLPLFFAVTVVAAIMYHYQPAWTPFWTLLALGSEIMLFRLFAYVDKHHIKGGVLFCAAGLVTLALALTLIWIGENPEYTNNFFVPKTVGTANDLDFYVWFLTPQSVVNTVYLPYTTAIFLLFGFFVGFTTYYFTFVQYRVLMSFAILCFPFAIYAKEDETMPVLCIILLFACYFAVMIFCRQMHMNDPEVVHSYEPKFQTCTNRTADTKSLMVKPRSEIADSMGWRTGAIFLSGACIAVLVLPKPEFHENRSYVENMINMAAFTDFLLNAISGFEEESDGGSVMTTNNAQTLFYADADVPANLRRATLSDYHYDTDSWTAGDYDRKNDDGDGLFQAFASDFQTALLDFSDEQTVRRLVTEHGSVVQSADTIAELLQVLQEPAFATTGGALTTYDLYLLLKEACTTDPAFAERWGLQSLPQTELDPRDYIESVTLHALTFNKNTFLAPNQTFWGFQNRGTAEEVKLRMNPSGILYCNSDARVFKESFSVLYLNDAIATEQPIQDMMRNQDLEQWSKLLRELYMVYEESDLSYESLFTLTEASVAYEQAAWCGFGTVDIGEDDGTGERPARVTALAEQLTAGLTSDYEKATAICSYLANGDYVYDLDYLKSSDANVETFLFESKRGVCYQFASAMTELCRAAGIPARYVEGYSMSEVPQNGQHDYVIRSSHAHGFTEAFIAGYGWMSFDATAPDLNASSRKTEGSVIGTLQIAGVILLLTALLLILLLYFIIPALQETLFRRYFRTHCDGTAVEKAFARLRKTWDADPALTARALCAEMSEKLHCGTEPLLSALEQTVYGGGCSQEAADAAYQCYCALCTAWKNRNKKPKAVLTEAAA